MDFKPLLDSFLTDLSLPDKIGIFVNTILNSDDPLKTLEKFEDLAILIVPFLITIKKELNGNALDKTTKFLELVDLLCDDDDLIDEG